MEDPGLQYEKRDGIAYITLNRPSAKNAIDPETDQKMWDVFSDFRDDDSVQVAILTGTGDAFCAGADLKKFIPLWTDATSWDVLQRVPQGLGGITRGLHRIYKPIIGAINGWALAGGFEIAMACDIRIASERAQFGAFETRRGYTHADGATPRVVNSAGTAVALELMLTADPVDAERALQMGLVSRVVPHQDLMASAEKMARSILRNDPIAVQKSKQTVIDMIGKSLDEQLTLEALYGYSAIANPAVKARLQNFYNKVDPDRASMPHYEDWSTR